MATRATKSQPATPSSPAAFSVPSLARGAVGPSLGSVPLRLRSGRGPWTWCVSAAKLGCLNGRIVPLAVPAWHAPGLSGNVKGDAGRGFVRELEAKGFQAVPHNFAPELKAFGQPLAGAPDSIYLRKWEGVNIEGRSVVRWTDAWQMPVQLGHIVHWERDEEGRTAYLIRALIDIANGGRPLSDVQIKIATAPVIDRIESEANRASERSRLLIQQLANHLPREHYTDSVRQILKRQEIEIPDAPDTK